MAVSVPPAAGAAPLQEFSSPYGQACPCSLTPIPYPPFPGTSRRLRLFHLLISVVESEAGDLLMPKRIEYIDIARGIGILLVVLGHNDFAAFSPFFHQVIYSFHIPLFFFLSGYFINTAISFFEYSRRRFHAVLKPYLFTIALIYF